MQVLCGGLHALNVLALQNEMQNYHQVMEGTPDYVNVLEDAQKRSKRAGNLTTEDTLLLITTNTMLSTERLPQAEKIWKELPKKGKVCPAWKNLYKAAGRKAKVKKQAVGGQDQFGAAYGALR